jgi:hypothetical protein
MDTYWPLHIEVSLVINLILVFITVTFTTRTIAGQPAAGSVAVSE